MKVINPVDIQMTVTGSDVQTRRFYDIVIKMEIDGITVNFMYPVSLFENFNMDQFEGIDSECFNIVSIKDDIFTFSAEVDLFPVFTVNINMTDEFKRYLREIDSLISYVIDNVSEKWTDDYKVPEGMNIIIRKQ